MPAGVGVRRNALRTRSRSGGASASGRIAELQRARLLAGAVLAAEELGWSATTVAHITARARVSRRTFYDLFENREDCLLAVLQDVVERIEGEIAAVGLAELGWADRVRGGLFAILSFFDREPVLARVCVVQALQGGPRVLVWREGILARLAAVVDQGRVESARAGQCTELTAEGLVGAACAIVQARISSASIGFAGQGEASRSRTQGARRTTYASDRGRRDAQPLVVLLGELMGLIVLPYRGAAAARRECNRALPAKAAPGTGKGEEQGDAQRVFDPLQSLPMRLTYRTARVLGAVAAHPGASNRTIGEAADIYDQGQISKLLSRLERLGLLANTGVGHAKGEANAWGLTELGVSVAQGLNLDNDMEGAR
jgi:AcrR family transcriptional regulator